MVVEDRLKGVQLAGADAALPAACVFGTEEVQESLRSLAPAGEARLTCVCPLQVAGDLAQMRRLAIAADGRPYPMLFLSP
jgi:hypothetical protein